MAHPLRARLLSELATGPASPVELARRTGQPLQNVSYHVAKLVELGCAELVATRPVRGAVEHTYRALIRADIRVTRL